MTGRQEVKYKIVSVLMVAGFLFSFFAGITPVNAAQTPTASISGTGDLTISPGEEFVIDGYDHYIGGNVTVDGGTLRIINGSLSFLQDIDHIYHMSVLNRGRVIMENGTITDHLDRLHTYPYVNMTVSDSEVLMYSNSSLKFPGWLNVTDSYFNMTASEITSIDNENISTYVGDTRNTTEGDNANDCPVINFSNSQVYLYDSSISNLFEYRIVDGNFHTDNFNLTLSGSTNFTAINSYISIDLSNITNSFGSLNNTHTKNALVLEDSANAYLYGLRIDESETPSDLTKRDTAFALNTTGSAYLFRWANYTVLDNNSLPVPGAAIDSTEITNGSSPLSYPSSHGDSGIPPLEVLNYLGKDSSNFNLTDERGEVIIPYLTDIVVNNLLNSEFLGNYLSNATYAAHRANASFSFDPYPSLNATANVTIQFSDLALPLPDLSVSSVSTTPATIFEGDSVTLTAVVNNTGGSNAVDVNVSFYDGGNYINSSIAGLIMPGGSVNVSVVWNTTMTTVGSHVINVTVDPLDRIVEENEDNNTYLQQVNVGRRLPDLMMDQTDISSTPATPYAGNDFTISAVIHNIGDVNASGVRVAFYNGTPDSNNDSIVDLNADLLGTTVIDVPYSSQITANLTTSFDTDGTYDIYVWVDPDNSISEYSNANNLAHNSITVLPKPNLQIGSSDISFSDPYPYVGQTITITAMVHNTGALAVSDSFDVYFFLDVNSPDALIGIYSYNITTDGNIAPEGNASASIFWVANSSGEHTIIVSVNYNRTVDESTYLDNIADSSLIVMRVGGTDLIVNDTSYGHLTLNFDYSLSGYVLVEEHGVLVVDDSALSVVQDSYDQYCIIIRNSGTVYLNDSTISSNYHINIYLYDSARLVMNSSSLSSVVSVIAHDSSVLEMENSTVSNSISMPDATSSVKLTAMNSTFSHALNNVHGNTLLSLTNVEVPSISLSDTSVARIYRWLKVYTVDGTGHQLSNVTVRSYFPLNGTEWNSAVSDGNGECLLSLLTDTLYGDAPREIIGEYMINGSYVFQNTTYFSEDPYITTDNYPLMQNLAEYQYNSVVLSFDSLKPDLDPRVYLSNPNPVLGVDSIYINSTVWNNGTAAAYNVDVRFYDNSISIGDVYIDKLEVGDYYNCSIQWTVTGPLGTHNISVVADPNNQISELNETNNTGWTTINVIGWPDLTLSSGDITFSTQGPMRGGVLTVSATIHNIGDSASEATQVAFFDGNPEAGGTQFAIVDLGPIDNGDGGMVVAEWSPDSAGNHSIYVVIDPEGSLNETNEGNNVAYKTINVKDWPDLSISSSSISFSYLPNIYGTVNAGEIVDISVTVYNGGQSPATNVNVVLTDTTTGLPVGSENIPDLPSKNYFPVTFHWNATITSSGATQEHTFRAVVDPYNQISETNEQNNNATGTLTVRDPRPDISFAGDLALNYTSENLTGGDEVNISFTLRNSGVHGSVVDVLINATLTNGTEYTIGRVTGVNVSADNQTASFYIWTVDLPADTYSIRAIADPDNVIDETNENNNEIDNATVTVVPPAPVFGTSPPPSISMGLEYKSGSVVTITGSVVNQLNGVPLAGVAVTATLLDSNGQPVIDASGLPLTGDSSTGDDGRYTILLTLPADLKTGDYSISVSAEGVNAVILGPVSVQGPSAGLSWLYILLAIVLLAGILGPIAYLKFSGALGEMVECGACGALIPAGSKKCPKCGVEFETETAKCSVCGAWIPVDAPVCPECGAVFAPTSEEEEYQQKMHEEYEAEVLAPLKEMAKAELGDEYEDEKFMEWAQAQEGFITFDDWLAKREEEREKMIECPVCGTLNPPDAIVCQACGSELPPKEEVEKDEEKGERPKKVLKKKIRKSKPLEEKAPEEKSKEEGVSLGLDDVLGEDVLGTASEEKKPEARKIMSPRPSDEEKTEMHPPATEASPQAAQPLIRKVVKKPVKRRVVKKPVKAEEKKE